MYSPPLQLELELMKGIDLSKLRFRDACLAYLETRRSYISERTYHEYELSINTLTKTFGTFYPPEIGYEQIYRYQKLRQREGCGPSGINRETSFLQQLLKRIGTWEEIKRFFQPLKLPKWRPGKIISEQERQILWKVGKSKPNWEACYLFAVISVNSSAGPHEVLTLRHQDVDLGERQFCVQAEGAKRDPRVRVLTLNDDSLVAMTRAIVRAHSLGSIEPEHYIFPSRIRATNKYDPTHHQTTFRTAWRKMVKAAGFPDLRMYDLRRTAITDLLADPENSEETVVHISGHVGRQMLSHYSYRRIDKVRSAIERLAIRKKPVPQEVEEEAPAVDVTQKKPPHSVRHVSLQEAVAKQAAKPREPEE